MDRSRALHQLMESGNLVKMLEELVSSTQANRISSSSWSGLQISLRNIHSAIVSSYDVLAADVVKQARESELNRQVIVESPKSTSHTTESTDPSIEKRKDELRKRLEQYID